MSLFIVLTLIADLYTPVLALFYTSHLIKKAAAGRRFLLYGLLCNLTIAWGWMFADQFLNLWPAWSLDYSTHTAVALALVISLSFSTPQQSFYWIASLIAYALLMMALGYHSAADIMSTAIVAGGMMEASNVGLQRICRAASDHKQT